MTSSSRCDCPRFYEDEVDDAQQLLGVCACAHQAELHGGQGCVGWPASHVLTPHRCDLGDLASGLPCRGCGIALKPRTPHHRRDCCCVTCEQPVLDAQGSGRPPRVHPVMPAKNDATR